MPQFNGTGPLGKGPITGKGNGFCILKHDTEKPGKLEGYTGLKSDYYSTEKADSISVFNIPAERSKINCRVSAL